MSYLDQFEPDNMPTTPVEVLTIMIDQLQNTWSDIEYLYTEEFNRLTYTERTEALFETRRLVEQMQQEQKELMSLATKMFSHAYTNAIDLMDRLRHAAEE